MKVLFIWFVIKVIYNYFYKLKNQMAGGGGGIKKLVINTILDKPVQVYIGGGIALWALRQY